MAHMVKEIMYSVLQQSDKPDTHTLATSRQIICAALIILRVNFSPSYYVAWVNVLDRCGLLAVLVKVLGYFLLQELPNGG